MKSSGCWVAGNWAWLVLVLEVLAVGCGGETKVKRGGIADAAVAGAAGESEVRPRAADVPYVVDVCDSLGLQFDAFDDELRSDQCPVLSCDCPQFYPGPLPTNDGCVVGLDCDAACKDGGASALLSCAFNACSSDDECGGALGFGSSPNECLIPPGYDHGLCGARGVDCIADRDCTTGSFCVVLDEQGARRCVEPAPDSSCNDDRQCLGGAACVLPEHAVVGVCSAGQRGDRCFADLDCRSGLHCGAGSCADGRYDDGCDSDDECASNSCRWETCVEGRDWDFCDADDDCKSGICVLDVRCASGETDAICERDADCKSGLCAADKNADSACTSGEPGSKCLDDGDCRTGACDHDQVRAPGSRFGACG